MPVIWRHAIAVILAAVADPCAGIADSAGGFTGPGLEQVLGAEVVHGKDVCIQDLVEGCLDELGTPELHQLLLHPTIRLTLLLLIIPAPPRWPSEAMGSWCQI